MRELQDTESDWLSHAAGSRKSNTTTDVFLSGNSKMTLQPRLSASLRRPCPSLPINGRSHERTAAAVTGHPFEGNPQGRGWWPPPATLAPCHQSSSPHHPGAQPASNSSCPAAPHQPRPQHYHRLQDQANAFLTLFQMSGQMLRLSK